MENPEGVGLVTAIAVSSGFVILSKVIASTFNHFSGGRRRNRRQLKLRSPRGSYTHPDGSKSKSPRGSHGPLSPKPTTIPTTNPLVSSPIVKNETTTGVIIPPLPIQNNIATSNIDKIKRGNVLPRPNIAPQQNNVTYYCERPPKPRTQPTKHSTPTPSIQPIRSNASQVQASKYGQSIKNLPITTQKKVKSNISSKIVSPRAFSYAKKPQRSEGGLLRPTTKKRINKLYAEVENLPLKPSLETKTKKLLKCETPPITKRAVPSNLQTNLIQETKQEYIDTSTQTDRKVDNNLSIVPIEYMVTPNNIELHANEADLVLQVNDDINQTKKVRFSNVPPIVAMYNNSSSPIVYHCSSDMSQQMKRKFTIEVVATPRSALLSHNRCNQQIKSHPIIEEISSNSPLCELHGRSTNRDHPQNQQSMPSVPSPTNNLRVTGVQRTRNKILPQTPASPSPSPFGSM